MSSESITPGSIPPRSAQGNDPMDVDTYPPKPKAPPAERKIPYRRSYEDGVMKVVLNPPVADGIEVKEPLPAYLASRPEIPADQLPLPLDDSRRQFRSEIPGIRLTHAQGLYEGGGLEPADEAEDEKFAQDLIRKHGVKTKEDLERAVAHEMEAAKEELRQRMQRRKEAIDVNEAVEKELNTLKMDREFELNAQKRIIEKARAKKEERKAKRTRLGPTHEARDASPSPAEPDNNNNNSMFFEMKAPVIGPLTNPAVATGAEIRKYTQPRREESSSDLEEEGEIIEEGEEITEENPAKKLKRGGFSISAGRRSGMLAKNR